MDDYHAAFISRIDKLAFDMGWSKKRFAMEVGISEARLCHIRHMRYIPTIEDCIKISDKFGVSIDWILGRE